MLDIFATSSGNIDGSGTANTITKFTDTDTIGNSNITDDGSTVAIKSPVSATGGLSAAAVTGTSYFGGNVGIGTTSPGEKLEIAAGCIQLDSAYAIQWGGNKNRIWGSDGNCYIKIETDSTERLRVAAGGCVGIGTATPEAQLIHCRVM